MHDETEDARRARIAEIHEETTNRAGLEARYGQVWSTDELRAEFEIIGFLPPFCMVRRIADRKRGTLEFQHNPRFYFSFQEG